MAVSYVTLYLRGSNQPVQVVEGSTLHLIYASMGASATPGVNPPVTRPDPFPQYVHDDEVSSLIGEAQDSAVAALVDDSDSATGVALKAAFGRGQRPTGHRVAIMGTSLDANAYAGQTNYYPHTNPSWFNLACALSGGRMVAHGAVAVPGATTQQIHDLQLPQVLALSPRPNACIVGGGPNEAAAGPTEAWKALVRDICDQLRAAGIVPILKIEPPRGLQGSAANSTDLGTQHQNRWKTAYAAAEGIPTVDAYTPLVHPSGGITTAYGAGDGVHLSEQGYAVLAADVITRQKLHELFPYAPPRTSKHKTDGTNLLGANGVFTGSAPGWSQYVTPGTVSLVTPAAGDNISGSWLQGLRASGTSGDYLLTYFLDLAGANANLMSGGDVVEVSYRLQTSGLNAHGGTVQYNAQVSMNHPEGKKYVAVAARWGRDIDGTIVARIPIPDGITSFSIEHQLLLGGVTLSADVSIRCAEVTYRNLTDLGLLAP